MRNGIPKVQDNLINSEVKALSFRRRTHPGLAFLGFFIGVVAAMAGNIELLDIPQGARFSWYSPSIREPANVEIYGKHSEHTNIKTDPAITNEMVIYRPQNSISHPLLKLHSQGVDVCWVQQRLSELGFFTGEITGYYDESTQRAVMAFQKTRGLQVDGIVGSRTYSALGI